MATLHLLGTGAAFSGPQRTTTMLAVEETDSIVVIDCGGDVVQRLLAANLPIEKISALIITHEHADHVGGFPLFMEKIWLAGRRNTVVVCGIAPALDQARRLWESYDTSGWEGVPRIAWQETPYAESALVLDDEYWHIAASPVIHFTPSVGLRIKAKSGGTIAYSGDTEPTDSVQRLATRADILIHEATGEGVGHSSALQAAVAASKSGVKQLILVHLPPDEQLSQDEIAVTLRQFPATRLGYDGARYKF